MDELFHAAPDCTLMPGKCLTHDVHICRCGWQEGYHFGIFSQGLSNRPQTQRQWRLEKIHSLVESRRKKLKIKKLTEEQLVLILLTIPKKLKN